MQSLSLAEARRIAIAAQGLTRRFTACGARQLDAVLGRIGVLQMDSVSVLARAHYLPLFSRLGCYDKTLLDAAAWGRKRRWFEYWGHEASLMPFALHPLLRWRMAEATSGIGLWSNLRDFQAEHRTFIEGVRARIAAGGPVVASDIDGDKGVPGWWGWGQAKRALEILFWRGEITTASRRGFERIYDLTERVLPPEILARPTPSKAAAQKDLLRLAARAHGIASVACLSDYFRISPIAARPLIAELVEAGELLPVSVEALRTGWYLHEGAAMPRRVSAQSLLAPFDPLVWSRTRTEHLFAFRYRLEIYTPAEKRVHGYYVLPFLLGNRLVARVDLKSDRPASALNVLSAYAEPDAPPETAEALHAELRRLADWLSLEKITITQKGDLSRRLRAHRV